MTLTPEHRRDRVIVNALIDYMGILSIRIDEHERSGDKISANRYRKILHEVEAARKTLGENLADMM